MTFVHTNLSQFKCCVTAEIKNIPNLGYKYSFGNRVLVLVDHTFAVKISSYEHDIDNEFIQKHLLAETIESL